MRKDYREVKNMSVLEDQERLADICDKMILHFTYTDIEVMSPEAYQKLMLDIVYTANSTEFCPSYVPVLEHVQRLIEENDSYVEVWYGANDDLTFIYDLLIVRIGAYSQQNKANKDRRISITITVG